MPNRRHRILFLNGPSQDCCDRFFGWPTSLLYAVAPTSQAVRAGTLEFEVVPKLFDPIWYVEGLNDHTVRQAFRAQLDGVRIVCGSATYDSLYPTLRLFAEAKALDPTIVTILGGPHFDEAHSLRRFNDVLLRPDVVDFAIAGDGEYALLSLLRAVSCGDLSLQGVAEAPGKFWLYSADGARIQGTRPLVLDDLPFIPIELADGERHRNDFDIFTDASGILPTIQMIAKRGCAYECSFCSERRSLAYPNTRSIDHILREVYLRKTQGFRAVFFDDSTLGLYPRLRELLGELSRTGLVFGSLNRFNHLVDPDLVRAYREAGFVYMYCAIEQMDDNALRRVNKDQSVRTIQRSMELLAANNMMVGVSLLYGLPGESERTIRATLDFVEQYVHRGTIRLVSESVLSLHPGTPLGANLLESFHRVPPHPGFPFDRFEEGQWNHLEHVSAAMLARVLEQSEQRFAPVMVRNRHSWYAANNYILANPAMPTVGSMQLTEGDRGEQAELFLAPPQPRGLPLALPCLNGSGA